MIFLFKRSVPGDLPPKDTGQTQAGPARDTCVNKETLTDRDKDTDMDRKAHTGTAETGAEIQI